MNGNLKEKKIFPSQKKEFFPGKEKGEKVIFFARRHPLSFLGLFVFAVVMALAPLIIYWIMVGPFSVELSREAARIILVLGSAYLLFVLGFFLVGWIDYYMDVIIVTDFRIVDINQGQLFSRSIAEANLTDIEDVNAEVKGILPTLFHFGTVFVQTAGTARNFEFCYIPNPYRVSKMISDLHQDAILREEAREAEEIGTTIAEKSEQESVNREQIDEAAKKMAAHRRKEVPRTRSEEEEDISKNKPPIYEEGSGWGEIDSYPPKSPSENEPRPQSQPEQKEKPNEPTKKDEKTIDHDDLEKGGEAEF